MSDVPVEITGRLLLLVEGNDECRFFGALLDHFNITGSIQILDYRGKDNLAQTLGAYVMAPGFADLVSAVGIVRDADENAAGAWDSVKKALEKARLPIPDRPESIRVGPPAVNVLITPGSGKNGKLETLCLKAISTNPAMDCVNKYVECLKSIESNRDWEKVRIQAFIASVPKASVRLLGEAARAGNLNFESNAYSEVVTFVRNLLSEIPQTTQ